MLRGMGLTVGCRARCSVGNRRWGKGGIKVILGGIRVGKYRA